MIERKLCVFSSVLLLAACGKKDAPPDAVAPEDSTTMAAEDGASGAPADSGSATTAPEDSGSATTAPADAAAAPSEACTAFGKLSVDYVTLDGDRLAVCGAAERAGWCFDVTLASGAVTATKLSEDDLSHVANTPGAIEDPFRRKDEAPVLQFCKDASTGCKDLYVGQALAAQLAADGQSIAVVTLDEREKHVRIYDGNTLAEIGNHVVAKDVDLPDCSFAAPLGAAVVVSTGPCGDGARAAWLIDPQGPKSGTKLADVGAAADFALRLGGFVHVDGDRWAFRDANGKKVVIQDVKSGEVTATVDLSALADKDAAAWMFVQAGKLVLVENRPAAGGTLIVDPASGKVERTVSPDACAAP